MAAHDRRTSHASILRGPTLRERTAPTADRRRGNSLILVTAILVLLVIVAAAFLSRTQAGRQVSSAQQQAIQREERVEPIANMVVDQIASALFPQPVDPNATAAANIGVGHRVNPADPSVLTATSSYPRLATEPNATIFGIDRDGNGDYAPDFGYNAAPYETRAWTNWPDFLSPNFPYGPGQLDGRIFGIAPADVAIGDANPLGNPGFNDNRWLRSTEPRRFDTNNDGLPDGFSHWEHLTWLANASNGFRVCTDISNIFGNNANGAANLLTSANESDFSKPFAIGMPYEQWLSNFPPAGVSSAADFRSRVNSWFAPLSAAASYPSLYSSTSALPNVFRLKDLPADLRAEVGRTFADTDGDGVTDAFWFLAPTSTDRSVRYLVASSIIDLSSLLNVNVATRFNPWNTAGMTPADLALVGNSGSAGESVGFFDNPGNAYDGADTLTSLFTQQDIDSGLYAPALVSYSYEAFGSSPAAAGQTFLKSIGMRLPNGSPNPALADIEFQQAVNTFLPALGEVRSRFYSDAERLQYFKSGRNAEFGITPFGMSDEIELRAYHGQNNPWTTTRLESAINPQDKFAQFFRSTPLRGETNEDVAQTTLRGLFLDNRRKATTINGARNDLAPPSTWPSPFADPRIDYNGDHFVADANADLVVDNPADPTGQIKLDLDAYNRQKLKLDLRRPFTDRLSNGALPNAAQVLDSRLVWRNDVQRLLERSLVRIWFDATSNPAVPGYIQSYLGRQVDPEDVNPNDGVNFTPTAAAQKLAAQKTMHMAAAMAANVDAWRDGPDPTLTFATDPPMHPEFGATVPDWVEPNSKIRYIGQERQPFFMEAFFALVYPKSRVGAGSNLEADLLAKGYAVTNNWAVPVPFKSAGEHFVDSSSKPGVVLAIQVGNPTDLPLNLFGFGIRVNSKTYTFAPNAVLPPTTRERPATAIVYAFIPHDPASPNVDQSGASEPGFYDEGAWIDFLDIKAGVNSELAPGSIVVNATAQLFGGITVNSPATYAQPSAAPFYDTKIELVRIIPHPSGDISKQATVVLDRFENPDETDSNITDASLRVAINRLFEDPERYPPVQKYDILDPDIDRWYMNGVRIKEDDYLVEYARISRLWTWDVPERQPDLGSNVARGQSDGVIRPNELSPRFAFAFTSEARPKKGIDGDLPNLDMQSDSTQLTTFEGDTYAFEDAPDGDGVNPGSLWITFDYTDIYGAKERDGTTDRPLRRGKPTFFPCITRHVGQNNVYLTGVPFPTVQELLPPVNGAEQAELGLVASFQKGKFDPFTIGDKGFKKADWERIYKAPAPGAPVTDPGITYHDALMWPFQMNIKDDDFEQIGELLNVFCWGPVIDCAQSFITPKTTKTFSEILMQEKETEDQPAGRGIFVNRLRITPYFDDSVALNNLSGRAPTDGPTPLLAPPLRSASGTATGLYFTGKVPAGDLGRVAGRLDMPSLPAGTSIFDAVVCDDRGWRFAANERDQDVFRQRNAAGYSGEITPGLVNLSTALPEVMRTLPHMTALVNNDSDMHYVDEYGNNLTNFFPQTLSSIPSGSNPVTRVVDSIQRYRDKTINGFVSGTIIPPAVSPLYAPYYYDRGVSYVAAGGSAMLPSFVWGSVNGSGQATSGMAFNGLRGERGLVSIGELLLTQRVAANNSAADWNINKSYSIEFAGLDPYKLGGTGVPPVGSYGRLSTPRLATDREQGRGNAFLPGAVASTTDDPLPRKAFNKVVPDRVGGDAEERNMLFAGLSNMVSVRSDVFAVYLRIKSVKQDPVNGRWDATDPTLLVDDSRYVMVVDRSNVKKPGDRPRILAFQRVESPN